MKMLTALLGSVGAFVLVSSIPAFSQPTHVVGLTTDGKLWHTIRQSNGVWQAFGDVGQEAGQRGIFSSVTAAFDRMSLHVAGVTRDGQLLSTIRQPNGVWRPFGPIQGQTGARAPFSNVVVSASSAGLSVVATTRDGRMWHTIRTPTGTWLPFGDVKSQAGDPGSFVGVAAAVGDGQDREVRAGGLPRYKPPLSVPPQRAVGHGCDKCDSIDSVPVRSVSGDAGVKRASEAALRSLKLLTQSDPSWLDSYIAEERASAVGQTLEGKLFMRVDAIEMVTKVLH